MFQASFETWIQLLGAVLTVGIIALTVGIIVEKRRRSRQTSGLTTTVKLTATLEQAGDGTWTAAVIGTHTILGAGATKEEAIEDLRRGVAGVVEYLKRKGEPLPQSSIEYLTIEVAT